MTELLGDEDLAGLEAQVQHALESGRAEGLRILGYGEITLVLGWPAAAPVVACKRLPVFPDGARAAAYGALVLEYVDRLRAAGVRVVPTQWRTTPSAHRGAVGYVLQEALPDHTLATQLLAARPEHAEEVLRAVLEQVHAVVGDGIGLDAQLSNWAWTGAELSYFDVTTPMLSDPSGRTRLDLRLLSAPLPALARPAVARYVAPGIVADYHRPRAVAVDLIGNLLKERLDPLVDTAISVANERVGPPISRREIDSWYRANARLWEALLRLRRADRWWQRRVRRRAYPFLLPGPISR